MRLNIITGLRKDKIFVNGLWFTFFSFFNQGINFLLLLVLSRFLSPAEYGYLNLFNTFILFITIFISFNSEKLIVVNYFRVSKAHTSRSVISISIFALTTLLLYSLFTAFFSNSLRLLMGFPIAYLYMAIAYCFFNLFSSFNLAIWKAEKKIKSFGTYSSSIVIMNCLVTIVLLVVFHKGWISRAIAQFSVGLLFFLISLVFLIKNNILSLNCPPRMGHLKEALAFGLPMVPSSLSWWAIQGVNRFVIHSHYGPTEVGLYSLASNFANIIQVFGTSFVQSFHVDVYKLLTEKVDGYERFLGKYTLKMILVYFAITLTLLGSCQAFIPVVFPNYRGSLAFLLPLCIGALAHCINQLFIGYLMYDKRTKAIMNITLFVSSLNVGLGLVLIPVNLILAAYIGMLSEILVALLYFICSRKTVILKYR